MTLYDDVKSALVSLDSIGCQSACLQPSKAAIRASVPTHQQLAGGIDKPGVALLPMGDLLNHDPGHHVAWHTGPSGLDAFHFITHTPIAQASSVLCCCPTQAKQYILQ